MLKARGVDVIFGIPGVHNQEMYRGIEEAGITHVLARHEQGAGFMADGYARATGRPGVAYVITGPGLCNIMTPMGQAYSDSVPMLVISSCLDDVAATRGQLHQMLDQAGAARTVCDWSYQATTADAAYALIDRAWFEFFAERPRSKHVQVPIKQAEGVAAAPPEPVQVPDGPPFHGAGVQDRLAARAANALVQAERPLVVFGGGARQCRDVAQDILSRCGAASFVSYAGRGVVPPGAPLHFGSYLARPSSAAIVAQADLLMVVGCELSETDLWRDELGHDCPLIRVDIDAEVLSHQFASIAIQGDAGEALSAISAHLPEGPFPMSERAHPWQPRDVARTKETWRAEVDAERPGILPVIDALKAALPEGCMIYSDMTQFAYAAKEVWDMDRPGHWHHPTGFGTLGYALPAAIGGAVGRPGLPTLAIAGDYGLQYTIQELGTAVELGLPLPIFVWDNEKLGEIEDSMVAAQIAPNAVTLKNPDFCALARAWGAYAVRPATLAEMTRAVQEAFAADAPTLIHVTPGMS
ncbi:thiamine pyrophosphate-binding protein [Pseudaestuariivita atlantica]|uniref:Acetolactate synthase isozyme1 large subunit n=1 Tax=Pseudaestuariivita atlantica TaxID=1317121 RepID=A0A0L1JUX0_9RHOB|nr:acetolactate synthase isozyme1 large subunit [Pseudaestuariivita atlantica]